MAEPRPFASRKALVAHVKAYTGTIGSLGRAFKRAAQGPRK